MKKIRRKSNDCRQETQTAQLLLCLSAILLLVSGCARYHPMPLTTEAVHAQLHPPDPAQLRLQAGNLHHPLLPPVELHPDQGLTPESAAILAVLLNPSLRAIRDRRALASAQVLSAGLLPDPELSFDFAIPTGGDTTGRVNAFGLGMNWNVSALLFRTVRKEKAETGKKAILLDIAWREWQVALAAKDAVYQLVSLHDQVALAVQLQQLTGQRLARMKTALVVGTITQDRLDRAIIDDYSAHQTAVRLKKQERHQYLHLMGILGLSGNNPITLSKHILLPTLQDLPSCTELLKGLGKRRLDLLALRRGYDAQEASVRAAILNQFPKIDLGPAFNRDTDNIQTNGFSLTVSLPFFNRNQGNIALERATRKRLFDEYADRIFKTRSDIGMIVSGIRFTHKQLAWGLTTESDLGRREKTYRSALAQGRIDARSYDTIQENLLELRIKTAALKGQMANDLVGLELATGLYRIPGLESTAKAQPLQKGTR